MSITVDELYGHERAGERSRGIGWFLGTYVFSRDRFIAV